MLKEHLIDKHDVEMPSREAPQVDENVDLVAQLNENKIEILHETEVEKKGRLTAQEQWDRWVLVGYTSFVAVAGKYSGMRRSSHHWHIKTAVS